MSRRCGWKLTLAQRLAISERRKAWWAKQPRVRKPRAQGFTKRYGLTEQQFELLWASQAGLCAICEKALERSRHGHAVDHDHVTNAIRGLLCCGCNRSLGWHEKYEAATYAYLTRPATGFVARDGRVCVGSGKWPRRVAS